MPHKDLEFHVSLAHTLGNADIFKKFEDAAIRAVELSISHGADVHVDVVTWSRAAAKKWGGDTAAEIYDEDPEASVHQRIVIRAHDQGRIA